MLSECKARDDIPNPEVEYPLMCMMCLRSFSQSSIWHACIQELFARLVVLLHDPLAREQQATQILTVSVSYLSLIRIGIYYEAKMNFFF